MCVELSVGAHFLHVELVPCHPAFLSPSNVLPAREWGRIAGPTIDNNQLPIESMFLNPVKCIFFSKLLTDKERNCVKLCCR